MVIFTHGFRAYIKNIPIDHFLSLAQREFILGAHDGVFYLQEFAWAHHVGYGRLLSGDGMCLCFHWLSFLNNFHFMVLKFLYKKNYCFTKITPSIFSDLTVPSFIIW